MRSMFSDKEKNQTRNQTIWKEKNVSKHLEIKQPSTGKEILKGSGNCTGMN